MFEDCLIESAGKIKTKTKYTTALSLMIQMTIIGVLVLIPLIYTEALPAKTLLSGLVAPPPPPPPPPPPAAVVIVKKIQSDIVDGALRTPTKIPNKVKVVVEEEAPQPALSGAMGGVPGGVPGGTGGGVLGGVLSAANMPPPRVAPSKLKISSGVATGNLLAPIRIIYPPIAKAAHVYGTVVIQATISKQGTIENLRVLSGPALLIQAAVDAVKQARYRPFLLNGEPTEVETTVTVNYSFGGS